MTELRDLKNVGKATLADLQLLDINSVEKLAFQDATELFHKLEHKTKKRHDPCVWDLFSAIIYEAKTGKKTVWWEWTAKRKALEKAGKFRHAQDL